MTPDPYFFIIIFVGVALVFPLLPLALAWLWRRFFQPPKPPAVSRPLSASVPLPPVSSESGPKKETVRIPLTPDPLRSSHKKTQPLIAMPNVVSQNPPIAVAPVEKSSMRLYWVLLAMSALILIIQIWTYLS